MGTLYRRYGSKTELLQRMCVLAMEQGIEAAGEALEADDPWTGLCGYIRTCVEMRFGALGSLAGQIDMTDEMLSTARRGMTLAGEVVARAHRAGSLRPDVTALDIALLIESFGRRAPGASSSAAREDPATRTTVGSGRGAQRPGQAADGRVRRAARARRRPPCPAGRRASASTPGAGLAGPAGLPRADR